MSPAATFLAALAAFAVQTGTGPSATIPASDAMVERFMAAIPDSDEIRNAQWDIDAGLVARLRELNPGREADIEALGEEYRRCTSPVAIETTAKLLRDTVRALGDEKLDRLIAFYRSDDLAILREIDERSPTPETASEADLAEAARIADAYPLAEFMESMGRTQQALFQDEAFVEGVFRCEDEMRATLAGRGLRDVELGTGE